MTALQELRERVAPPLVPTPPSGDWTTAEGILGTPLPSDFKLLVETYGSGELCGHLYWLNPFFERPMHDEAEALLKAYRLVREVWPERCPWRVFPEPGGLLPWGKTANSEELYWITEGAPDEWKILGGDLPEAAVHSLSTTEFLVRWIDGSLGESAVVTWPELQPGVDAFFRPLIPDVVQEGITIDFAEADRPYAERLQIVLDIFAPARPQDSGINVLGVFTKIYAEEYGWELTYMSKEPGANTVAGASPQTLGIRLPSLDLDRARQKVVELSAALGVPIRRAIRSDQRSVWTDLSHPG